MKSGRIWLSVLDVVIGQEGKRESLFCRGYNYFIVNTAPLYGLLHCVYSPILFQVHLAWHTIYLITSMLQMTGRISGAAVSEARCLPYKR